MSPFSPVGPVAGGGLILGGLFFLTGLAVIGGVVILVLAAAVGRGEADPTGKRVEAVHVGVASVVALYLALFASFGTVASLSSLIGPVRGTMVTQLAPFPGGTAAYGPSGSGQVIVSGSPPTSLVIPGSGPATAALTSGPDRSDTVISWALATALLALSAIAVLAYHRRRIRAVLRDHDPGPAGRVAATYRSATSFVAVFVAPLAAAAALYGLYRTIAPGISQSAGRAGGIQEMIDSAYLCAGASWILIRHRNLGPSADLDHSTDPSTVPEAT